MAEHRQTSLADLVRVGKGTPGGEWLRRYWLAVGIAAELEDTPQAMRILDEELVLFRDGQGRLGLVGLHCSHRGTSLEYGDVEPEGIRCIYHGWLYDVQGHCLEQPAEPKGSRFCEKVQHPAYVVREYGGLLFAYLGPDQANPPPLTRYAPLEDRGGQRQIEPIRHLDYNWFNFWENGADPDHISILHRYSGYGEQTWGNRFFDYHDPPAYDLVETEWGLQAVMHKPGPTPDSEFVDVFSLMLPSILQIGDTEFAHLRLDEAAAHTSHNEHFMLVTPNDDDRFMLFTVDHYTGPDPDFFAKLKAQRAVQAAQQRVPDDVQRRSKTKRGVVRIEDVIAQGTQGLLGERQERLGVSDRGVILLRRLVREAIEAVQAGRRPKGVLPPEQADRIVDLDSFVGVRPRGLPLTAARASRV